MAKASTDRAAGERRSAWRAGRRPKTLPEGAQDRGRAETVDPQRREDPEVITEVAPEVSPERRYDPE
ncbi:MAG: hypothetical protein LC733_01445, partial [Actinobacteria bacterium]|nr:hypothetical protein [Actinomycetota bacterium]